MNQSSFGYADLHMHTCASDGVPTIRELLDHVANHTHLDVIAVTDHDRVDAALWAYDHSDEYNFDIIPGIEVTSAAGHVLGLWVKRPIKKGLSLKDTVNAIHDQGGVAVLAHPMHLHLDVVFRNFMRYVRQPETLVEAGLDGLEVHNAGIVIPGQNVLARWLGHACGIAVTGSSDAHTLGAVGCGVTRFKGHTAQDLRTAILQNRTHAEGRTWPLVETIRYMRFSTHNTSTDFVAERPHSVGVSNR